MIYLKSIFIILTHYFFIHFLFHSKLIKNNFDQKIFINSLSVLFVIIFFVFVTNSLNYIYFIISIMGICYFLIKNKDIKKKIKFISIIYITLFILLLLICVLPPLTSFDGRSIWFFHSKIIYYEKALWTDVWFNEEILFSQVHYPKLNAIISAYFSNLIGIWNYHFSKISLSVLIFPCLIFIYKFFYSPYQGLINLSVLLLFFKNDLFNGYMDSILSIYSLIALLSVYKIFKEKSFNEHMIVFGLSIFVVLNLKDEGIVIASLISLAFIYYFVLNYKNLVKNNFFYLTILICILGLIFNFGWKYFMISNDIFAFFGEKKIGQVQFNWGNMSTILKFIFFEYKLALYIILMSAINITNVLLKKNKILHTLSILTMLFFISYLSIIIIVYLISPLDISWHLHSSASRVLNTLKFIIIFNTINFLIFFYENRFVTKK